MTRNEIMEMARQTVPPAWLDGRCEYLEAFAKLVAAKEREAITDEYWSCVQSDLEHGVKFLNEEASRLFHISMPEVSKFGGWLEARGEA